MSSDTNTNYIDNVFEYPVLTKINGRPTYQTLKTIHDEIKANVSRVQSDAGGGSNGHLGLVLTATEYALVSAVPYVRPAQPAALNIEAGTTQHESTRLREEHKEAKRLFREANAVESAVIKQLIAAIPDIYMKQFRNVTSNAITTSVPDIFTSLFTTYGSITEDELEEKFSSLQQRVFDITEPLIGMYNEVEDLQRLATASFAPYTDRQLVNLGIRLIKNMHDFEKGLDTWYSLPRDSQTWVTFKTHFETAYTALLRLRGPTMRNTSFQQQANAISEKLLATIQKENDTLASSINAAIEEKLLNASSFLNPPPLESEDSSSSDSSANSLSSSDPISLEILKALKDLKSEIVLSRKSTSTTPSKKCPATDDTEQKRKKKKKPRRRFDVSHYCWTHGAWNHPSNKCKFPAPGHKNNATFKNMMGGCTDFCQICNDE